MLKVKWSIIFACISLVYLETRRPGERVYVRSVYVIVKVVKSGSYVGSREISGIVDRRIIRSYII